MKTILMPLFLTAEANNCQATDAEELPDEKYGNLQQGFFGANLCTSSSRFLRQQQMPVKPEKNAVPLRLAD